MTADSRLDAARRSIECVGAPRPTLIAAGQAVLIGSSFVQRLPSELVNPRKIAHGPRPDPELGEGTASDARRAEMFRRSAAWTSSDSDRRR